MWSPPLNDVERAGEHVEIARRRLVARQRRRAFATAPATGALQRRRQPAEHAADDLDRNPRRHGGVGRLGLGVAPPEKLAVEVTAMITSAPSARQTETGIGLLRRRRAATCRPMRTGLTIPGSAIEARTASWIGPDCSQKNLAAGRQSVATGPYCWVGLDRSADPRFARKAPPAGRL